MAQPTPIGRELKVKGAMPVLKATPSAPVIPAKAGIQSSAKGRILRKKCGLAGCIGLTNMQIADYSKCYINA